MNVQLVTRVILDPVSEKEEIEKYESNNAWLKLQESSMQVIFEHRTFHFGETSYNLPEEVQRLVL